MRSKRDIIRTEGNCLLTSRKKSFFKLFSFVYTKKEVDAYIKNICKKYGVFANIIEESVPLQLPFSWKSANEQLEMMFPGLGNRIQFPKRSIEMPEMALSTSRTSGRSSKYPLQRDDGERTQVSSAHNSDEIPQKRYRYSSDHFSHSIGGTESMAVQKQHVRKCLTNISGIVENVFDLNAQLDEKLKLMEQSHEIEMKLCVDENEDLSNRLTKLNHEMQGNVESVHKRHELEIKDLIDDYTRRMAKDDEKWESKLKEQLQETTERYENEIRLLKAKYERCTAQFESERKKSFNERYDLIERKNREKEMAVNEVKEKCRRECTARIEDAKNKKFCVGCGAGKPLELFYVCNKECQRRYWCVLHYI